MSKQIFVEVVSGQGGKGEQTYVDWSKDFSNMNEVVVALQVAIGAVMSEIQKQTALQQNNVLRPDFVPKRGMN